MTDATHAVTQSALESFAREYLSELGATIRDDGDRWQVQLPSHVDVQFTDSHEFDIVLDTETGAELDSTHILSPESGFAQRLLEEASEVAPIGQVSLTEAVTNGEYQYPPWILESDVDVDDATFSPYYDRTAICVFVRIDIETVSEYQTQFLEAVTVDVESNEPLPNMTELLVEQFFTPKSAWPTEATEDDVSRAETIATEKLHDVFSTGQKAAVENVEDEIAEVRQSASRAADSEFEEYRQLQEQRISELQKEISSLSTRLQGLSTEVDEVESPQQRVEALEKRKELKEEKEQIESELEGILQEKSSGYSQQKEEIDRRHAIKVNTEPKAFTVVLYERGEIELELGTGGRTAVMRAPYAIGAGVTDSVRCENCKKPLSGENPVYLSAGGVCCRCCR
ncbi:hypothetical protein EXE51_05060 [Halorubrum sp. CGM5_25_10-8B]|uniref:hypothetical protein n=1 Tax=Halorubrum sp. CGM5_25_10-8B TaxID=2518115 RepID=UPI0010F59DDF|nr:hypothetical protein [Halorubrum sp. CGM5_25_10-8B]TKX37966.1 hypothetical protein EXE51_05060 [Halorubrum sp. CGM5_25_10-8B]